MWRERIEAWEVAVGLLFCICFLNPSDRNIWHKLLFWVVNTWSTRGSIRVSALSLLRNFWVSNRKSLCRQSMVNCSSKQLFSVLFSESKKASSVFETLSWFSVSANGFTKWPANRVKRPLSLSAMQSAKRWNVSSLSFRALSVLDQSKSWKWMAG